MIIKRRLSAVAAIVVFYAASCSSIPPPRCLPSRADRGTVFVVSHGWHVDVGVPAAQLQGPLSIYRDIFPGAHAVMFGYGKRTFVTAPPETFSEYFIGPLPGPAAIQVTGLSVMPTEAYEPGDTTILSLPPGGAAALADFIGDAMEKDKTGAPRLIGPGPPGSQFYAARSQYNLLHTCNTWAVEALSAAGLPISSDAVVFSGQAISRAEAVFEEQCRTRD